MACVYVKLAPWMGETIQSKNQSKSKMWNRKAIQKQSAGPKTNPKAIQKLRKQFKNNPPKAQTRASRGFLGGTAYRPTPRSWGSGGAGRAQNPTLVCGRMWNFLKSQQNMLKTRSLKVTCKQEIAHVVKSAVLLTIVVVSRKLAEEPLNTGAAGWHGKHLTGHLLLVVVHLVL